MGSTQVLEDGPVVGIHLDLKYLMPRKAYLLDWVRALPAWGINTLLLEYEDKFPFRKHSFLRAEGAFTPEELREFLAVARGASLRVIPLVQTLSHLEFALAHTELAPLREAPDTLTQICPGNPDAIRFVHDLLDEVLAFHEQDEWFHIGADEAWSLGVCPACAARAAQQGKTGFWAEHTRAMCARVQARGKRPLVWDDALWKDPAGERELPREAILCSWHYGATAREPESALFRCAAQYRRSGRAFLGIPCANWGVLFPRRQHTLDNAAAVAGAVREHGGMGVINSAWACFHVPLPAYAMQIAATAELLRGGELTREWEENFFAGEFGVRAPGLCDALEALGRLWEVAVAGLDRPITPMTHGCMDLVLHFPRGHQDRVRNGAYPLDWDTIDFCALYLRKLDLLRALPADHAFHADLALALRDYATAVPVLENLAARATRRRPEAALLAALGRFKWLAVRALARQLDPTRRDAPLDAELAACRPGLERTLGDFYEPASVRRFLRMHADPVTSPRAPRCRA